MPNAGGLRDQAPEVMADFRFLHGVKVAFDEKARQKAEEEAKNQ